MLRDVQTYIADHGVVSMADLSLHFHSNAAALQPMLNKLDRKGRIRKLPMPVKCSDCTCCDHSELVCYEWVRAESKEEQRNGMESCKGCSPVS
jgi:hypothetical protein